MWNETEKALEAVFLERELNYTYSIDSTRDAAYEQRYAEYRKELADLCNVGEKTKSKGYIKTHMFASRKKREDLVGWYTVKKLENDRNNATTPKQQQQKQQKATNG